MREKKRKELGIIETLLHAMHFFIHDLISTLLTPGGVNRIAPIFQVEKLRPRGGKTFALDNELAGWNWSPGLLTSKIRVLPPYHPVPWFWVSAGGGVSLWVAALS